MNLAANASAKGYAMAALLVAMSVMAIIMSVALPTWSQMIRREKEEELVFRGNQYARAINLYQRRFANASPASIDILIEQRFLRKKYKDPMATDEEGEFQLLYVNSRAPQAGQQSATGTMLSTTPSGGIQGVTSKNSAESIRIFNGKTHYNEWQFIALQQSTQAGGGGQQPLRSGQGGQQGSGAQPQGGQGAPPVRGPQGPPQR